MCAQMQARAVAFGRRRPPARGLLVELKGASTFPHDPLLSLPLSLSLNTSASPVLIKRPVSEAPSGVAGMVGWVRGRGEMTAACTAGMKGAHLPSDSGAYLEKRPGDGCARGGCHLKWRDEGTGLCPA